MTKVHVISSPEELDALEARVLASAQTAAETLAKILQSHSPIAVLRRAKFEMIGADPLSDRPLNIIEQINQTFTYLASFEALRYLFREHAQNAPFRINLGTASGPDVSSVDGVVVAEVFAAVKPSNNRKLAKDVEKVSKEDAKHRYVFYSCVAEHAREVPSLPSYPNVRIVSLGTCGPA